MIHIVNGDALANKMKNFNGTVMPWREMYDIGPFMKNSLQEIQLMKRALFFEAKLGIPSTLFIENSQKQNKWVDHLPRDTEIILWFEHDRYDQTMLMYLLNRLSAKKFNNLSIISINHYPGIEPFWGLSQLSPKQLEELYGTNRRDITDDQIHEALDGWNAYTSTNPMEIENFIESSKGHLPFLKRALETHLSYFPSVHNGLNEVENLIFDFLHNSTRSFIEIFQYMSEQRGNDGLSDLHLAAILNQYTCGEYPLIQTDIPLPNFKDPDPKSNLTLTSAGLEVLHGNSDRFHFASIDWWLGGVHLQNDQWRWNQDHIISK